MRGLSLICFGLSLVLTVSIAIRLIWALLSSFRTGFGPRLGSLLRTRSLWLSLVAVLFLNSAAQVLQSAYRLGREGAVRTGHPALALDAPDMNGDQVTLADLRGRHVLLYFWNTGCAPCTAEIPELKQLQDRYPPERLTILGVAYDAERGPVERYIQHHEVPWRQILDGAENEARIHTRYEFEAWPSYYLIGPTGLIERTGRFTLHTLLDHGLEGHQTAMHRLALWLRGRTADLE